MKEFVLACAMYTEFKIRITFLTIPEANSWFAVRMKYYLLDNYYRKALIHKKVETKYITYDNGTCYKKIKF